jgi:transposase-like protein
MALVSRETGEVRSRIVPNIRRETLREAIAEQVDMLNVHLHTDQLASYRLIAGDFASHSAVHHGEREYVRGDVSTNQAETFFSQLKRSIDGTHHHVSREHLERYLAEFDFRYSTCKDSDAERMDALVGRVGGRRLLYKGATQAVA